MMPVSTTARFATAILALVSVSCAARDRVPSACADVAGRRPITVVAHRGWLAPTHVENSLRELRAARRAGIGAFEIDLRASRDGTLFLLHDATLDRTTTGTGRIDAAFDSALSRVTLKDAAGASTNEPLPRFDEVLAWAEADPGIQLMLDIKGVDLAALVRTLAQRGLDQRSLILTFDDATTTALLSLDHKAIVSVLVKAPEDMPRYIAQARGHRLAFYVAQDAERRLYEAADATGVPTISDAVMATSSGTLDERAQRDGANVYRDHLATHAVRYFVSNYPAQVRAAACTF